MYITKLTFEYKKAEAQSAIDLLMSHESIDFDGFYKNPQAVREHHPFDMLVTICRTLNVDLSFNFSGKRMFFDLHIPEKLGLMYSIHEKAEDVAPEEPNSPDSTEKVKDKPEEGVEDEEEEEEETTESVQKQVAPTQPPKRATAQSARMDTEDDPLDFLNMDSDTIS